MPLIVTEMPSSRVGHGVVEAVSISAARLFAMMLNRPPGASWPALGFAAFPTLAGSSDGNGALINSFTWITADEVPSVDVRVMLPEYTPGARPVGSAWI